ncbi:DNA (cytosine-5-)-methyltransferase [Legionella pneumophila]|uniref:DNA (cytosine-5-)-methyltransferase n=1 Tax=Legionella pneumophila TaxID=446 RepID=UPI0005B21FBC|nr:DNA (cytosine-5-)-methyltransferase [Legionella pneumophila]MDW9120411.1 DNA (cytosine-5-)-methyltransferase [Legionella pneumophila]HAT2080000.1 DNA (cytosine-5-)-methyltransferase [Legionella pneumophila]HBD7114628.1 DNA (cytosine-5-)-methyltransferase [Legionella pneumophila]HDU8076135.1 DNA (cytosine-5-)-methyltransferase [Legionella pneumophila]
MEIHKEYNSFSELRTRTGLTIPEVIEFLGISESTVYRWERGEIFPKKGIIELMISKIEDKNSINHSNDFTFIDLFAGIGGFRKAFDQVGGKCVFTSEWDKYSQLTYKANYNCDHEVVGDITKIEAHDIPKHDVLLAGFPCQPFSLAGVSKKNSLGRQHGFACETQGTLFFDVARIIDFHRPKAFLLENVKNLISHDKGKTFQTIKKVLTNDLGYHIDWKVLDARHWVPQHRERIFIAGFLEENNFSFKNFVFPEQSNHPTLAKILHPQNGTEKEENPYTEGKNAVVSDKYTLSDKLWKYLQAYAAKHREQGNGFGFGINTADNISRTLSARYHKDGSEILIYQKDKNPRRLTPRECARLMGFDNFGESKFKIPVSDTQAYRQFGNAVVVPVVHSVANYMIPYIRAGLNKELVANRPLEQNA